MSEVKKTQNGNGMSDEIKAVLAKYNLDSSAVWEVRRGAFAILHKAVEVIASREGVTFDAPEVIHDGLNDKEQIVIRVHGRINKWDDEKKIIYQRTEWSYGECSPKNNKNAYPWAMAEKRAKDRVVLKLIDVHGILYSDVEAEEIRAADQTFLPQENGDGRRIVELPKGKARDLYTELQHDIDCAENLDALQAWKSSRGAEALTLPSDWRDDLRTRYMNRFHELKNGEQYGDEQSAEGR